MSLLLWGQKYILNNPNATLWFSDHDPDRSNRQVYDWWKEPAIFELIEIDSDHALNPKFRYPNGEEAFINPRHLTPIDVTEPAPEPKEEPAPVIPTTTKGLDDIMSLFNETIQGSLRKEIDALAKDIAKKLAEAMPKPEPPKPEGAPDPKDLEYIKPAIWDRVYAFLKSNNILVFGPAGCGKTLMARQLAAAYDEPFYAISCSGGMRYSQLIGGTQLTVGKDGKQVTKFVPSKLLERMQEPGVTLLDEIFSIDPEAAQGLNGLLDYGTRSITVPDGTTYKVHPKHKFIACANTNGRTVSRTYTAPQMQDGSLLSRFLKVKMDYDENVEAMLLEKAKIPKKAQSYFKRSLDKLRGTIRQAQMPLDVGTRELTSAIRAYKALPDEKVAFEAAFLNGLSETERAKVGM